METDNFSLEIARRQYFQPGEQTLEDLYRRVARHVAGDDPQWSAEYFRLMNQGRFLPGGRVLAGAGTAHGSLLNCFVQGATAHRAASLAGLREVALKLALVTKVGGGNGVNLDPYPPRQTLRPRPARGVAYLRGDHPDAERFVLGLMVPSERPDGPEERFSLKRWSRALWGEVSPTLRRLAEREGVAVLPHRPEGVREVADDLADIVQAGMEAMERAIAGAVPELDLSAVRPAGSPVKGSGGQASGPYSFLYEFYDNFLALAEAGGVGAGPVAVLRYLYAPLLRGVRQGGVRRGAGMATLSLSHPDVLDFVTAKDPDRESGEGKIDTFNISVLVEDSFMEAVEQDRLVAQIPNPVPGKYTVRTVEGAYSGEWPEESEEGTRAIPVFEGGVPARWLWREIALHAHASGDPGVIFIDRVNQYSAVAGLGEEYRIRATNPCLVGSTPVLTPAGFVALKELARKSERGIVEVWAADPQDSCFRAASAFAFRTRALSPTVRLTYAGAAGSATLTLTPDHPVWVQGKGFQPAERLAPGDVLSPAPAHLSDRAEGEIRVVSVEPGSPETVYDLSVEGPPAFLAGAIPVVVHNCGEIPLTVGEPCDLGALNLAAYVREGTFDRDSFARDVRVAVRFLDDVLERSGFALEENRQAALRLRRLGLGVMGLADALIRLGLPYDSEAARRWTFEVFTTLREEAVAESEALAQERGTFPLYQEHREYFEKLFPPRRNVALLTVAPTGTTSMIFGVSSGIEPIFSPFIWRRVGGVYKPLLHPLFKELLESFPAPREYAREGSWDWEKVIAAIQADGRGSVAHLDFIPEALRKTFRCAHDIRPLDHVRMQGTVQRAIDEAKLVGNSLSKTTNLPHEATVEDVLEAFSEAYRLGCKGTTIYRDGSKEYQVLTVKSQEAQESKKEDPLPHPAPAPAAAPSPTPFERPARLFGHTDMVKLTTGEGVRRSFLITVNRHQGQPVEVIVTSGKAGDESNADSEALGRLVSLALQRGVAPAEIVHTLRGINGGMYGSYQGRLVASKADLIAVALESTPQGPPKGDCPGCGGTLVREEGCWKCYTCGYSKCG